MIGPGRLILGLDIWFWMGLCIFTAGAVLATWSYLGVRPKGPWLTLAYTCKVLLLFGLAAILAEPRWVHQQAQPGQNILAVVVDNSLSMTMADPSGGPTRGQVAVEALKGGWLEKVSQTFRVRRYIFDTRCRPLSDVSDLTFDSRHSNLGQCLRGLAELYAGSPLAGIILITDGLATDTVPGQIHADGLAPVYPVVPGDPGPFLDLAVSSVRADQTAFDDGPVTIRAEVTATALAGRSVEVSLLDPQGPVLETQRWLVRGGDQVKTVEFKVRPPGLGVVFYQVRAAVADDAPVSEATEANNSTFVAVQRRGRPYRVLYVSGRPNWEYKFLQRAVAQDQQLSLTALIRVARREPKYDFRGRPGQWTNPLYRGLEPNQAPVLAPYDRPVLVRLNVADPNELAEGFPKTARDLFCYHGLILDDVEAEFFDGQMELIRSFVSMRGGGLLVLGGMDCLAQGRYIGTAIEQVLPVALQPADGLPAEGPFSLALTREGMVQPWLRLRTTEQAEQELLASVPPFGVVNPLGRLRPGGTALAMVRSSEVTTLPALATGRFGNGRTAVLAIGDLWRWGMQNPQSRVDMESFWRRLIRWTVAQAQDCVTLQWTADGAAPRLQARVLDQEFRPVPQARVTINLQGPGGLDLQLEATQAPGQAGLYEAPFVPRSSGPYLASVNAPGIGQAQAGWAANLEAAELRSTRADLGLLRDLAAKTSGRLVQPDELDDLATALPGRPAPNMVTVVTPLWDMPAVLPLALLGLLACMLLEWTVRRQRGLA